MEKPPQVTQWRDWDFDNYKFIIHELFLYVLATFLKQDRIEQASYFLEQQYYVPANAEYGREVMTDFTVFRKYLNSIEHRNNRLGLRKLSLRAALLKERSKGAGLEFRHIMQADFIAFMRAEIKATSVRSEWWPETLIYLGHFNNGFELFARSISRRYFDRVKGLLDIDTPKDLERLLLSYRDNSRQLPRWEFNSFSPATLLNFDKLATQP